jgi:translocation and assembly module TamB
MPLEGFVADYEIAPQSYRAELSGAVPELLNVDATVSIDRIKNIISSSKLNLVFGDLTWLGDVLPAFHGTAGVFGLHASAGGVLTAPEIRARGRLESGQIALPDIGLRVAEFEFSGSADEQRTVRLDGRVVADGKPVGLKGHVTLDSAQGWPYSVSLRGDDFPLVRLPEMEVDFSPDLTLAGGREAARATGRIVIPRLHFELVALPETATAVSDDQVLIGPDGRPVTQTEDGNAPLVYYRDRLSGDVELVLGDDIEIKGLGLTTALTGAVRLSKNRGQLGQAEGKVTVKGGVFKAYGQKLTIEKGHLLFAGPVDNPSLNIRAVRPNIGVVAGVRVTGTAQDPRIEIFSEPPMSDAEKLSYILTGRSMTDASKGDAALITQAALGFGLEQSSVITTEVRDLFQLDEFGLSGGETVADTAVTAGKQISPRLSVRSEMNLFDQLWSFFLRYKLTDSWSVEAESGIRQGADVIYTIERDSLLGGSR